MAPSFFSSALRALPLPGFDFESFLVFFDFFFESLSRLESEELELESLLESLLELELELLAFLFFLSAANLLKILSYFLKCPAPANMFEQFLRHEPV